MSGWEFRTIELQFSLGDFTVARRRVPLQVKSISLHDVVASVESAVPPDDALVAGSRGFMLRGQPIATFQPAFRSWGNFICYVQRQYHHYYIDLRGSFDDYKGKFSAKTRSTIARKIKKYVTHCGGEISWRVYSRPEEMLSFHELAKSVSAKSYQERLLDAGLPNSPEFLSRMVSLAAQDAVRGYVLFDAERPVSYLYCPVDNGILLYAYLGYDPEYGKLSVGTVLQWLALEKIFAEGRFRFFDFTEGQSEHKRLFATNDRLEANIMFLQRNIRSLMLVHAHHFCDRVGASIGRWLEYAGLKSRVRKFIRFRAQPTRSS